MEWLLPKAREDRTRHLARYAEEEELSAEQLRRAVNRHLVGNWKDAAPMLHAYNSRDVREIASAPWHDDGLTPSQRTCKGLMRQDDIFSGGRTRRVSWDSTPSPTGSFGLSAEAAQARDYLAGQGWNIKDASTGHKRGRPRRGLEREALLTALREYGFDLPALREAVKARKRTSDQEKELDALGLFIVEKKPNAEALAELLGCRRNCIYTIRRSGMDLLTQLLQSNEQIEQRLVETNDRLKLILDLHDLDIVKGAEAILAEERAA